MTDSKQHSERKGFVRDVWLAAAAIGNARGRGSGDASAEWAEFDEALDALEEQVHVLEVVARQVPALNDAFAKSERERSELIEQLEAYEQAMKRAIGGLQGNIDHRQIVNDLCVALGIKPSYSTFPPLASNPAISPMAESYPSPEDIERAGELARERGWKDVGGQGVVSDPAKKLHIPSSIDTSNPAGEPIVRKGASNTETSRDEA